MLVFVTVLQRNIGVTYAKDEVERPFDCTDSRLHFIHGLLEGRGGTCTTMPVLFVALGRRLGYPLKLVSAAIHFFVRWDAPDGERMNIESTSDGLRTPPDDYYLTWPQPANPQHVEKGWHLKSKPPHEELAAFYVFRSQCYLDWLRFGPAFELARQAVELTGGERNSCYSWYYAVLTVLHKSAIGYAKYRLYQHGQGGVIFEQGRQRPMAPWEIAAVIEAEEETDRIRALHAERKQQGKPYLEQPSANQASQSPYSAVDACFQEELAT